MPAAHRLPHQKLPDKAELERLYLRENLSFDQLAERFGVRRKTVYNTMKTRREKAGEPWPLKSRRADWRARAGRKTSQTRDTVVSTMIRLEILHARDDLGLTGCEIARRAGVSQTAIWDTVSGRRARLQRATAQAIMAVIEAEETAQRRREAALNALNARRRKIAEEKAAGTRPPSQMDLRRQRAA